MAYKRANETEANEHAARLLWLRDHFKLSSWRAVAERLTEYGVKLGGSALSAHAEGKRPPAVSTVKKVAEAIARIEAGDSPPTAERDGSVLGILERASKKYEELQRELHLASQTAPEIMALGIEQVRHKLESSVGKYLSAHKNGG